MKDDVCVEIRKANARIDVARAAAESTKAQINDKLDDLRGACGSLEPSGLRSHCQPVVNTVVSQLQSSVVDPGLEAVDTAIEQVLEVPCVA